MLRTRRFAGGEKVRCQMPLHPRQLKFPVGVSSTPGLHPNCASPPPSQAGEELYWSGYAGEVDAYPNKSASYNLEAEQVTLPYVVTGNSIDLITRTMPPTFQARLAKLHESLKRNCAGRQLAPGID